MNFYIQKNALISKKISSMKIRVLKETLFIFIFVFIYLLFLVIVHLPILPKFPTQGIGLESQFPLISKLKFTSSHSLTQNSQHMLNFGASKPSILSKNFSILKFHCSTATCFFYQINNLSLLSKIGSRSPLSKITQVFL